MCNAMCSCATCCYPSVILSYGRFSVMYLLVGFQVSVCAQHYLHQYVSHMDLTK